MPTKKGRMGIMMRTTRELMMRSSSEKSFAMFSDFVQVMATPKKSASTRALMTLKSGGMSSRNTISGSLRSVSVEVAMERCGMMM